MRSIIISSVALALLAGCATEPRLEGLVHATTVIEGTTIPAVINKLTELCDRHHVQIDESTDNSVTCSQEGAVMAQVLLSTRYGSGVRERIKFTAFAIAPGRIKVTPQQWFENQTAYGQVQRNNINVPADGPAQQILNTAKAELEAEGAHK